jgi:hypothetical protein
MVLNYTKQNNMKITYAKSIYSLKENADFTIYNDDIDNIVWHDNNQTNIRKKQILDEQIRLQTIEDSKPEAIAEKAKADAKASALAKLKALGLNDAEIKSIIG